MTPQEQQIAALKAAINSLMTLDVKGHELQHRLQFSTPGRAVLAQVEAAVKGETK